MTFLNKARITFRRFGLDVQRFSPGLGLSSRSREIPVELSAAETDLIEWIMKAELTMGSPQRLYATAVALKHQILTGVSVGSFVECGVWRGGHSILAAGMFKLNGISSDVYLFDTFAGMTRPTEVDLIAHSSAPALPLFLEHQESSHNNWCYASLNEVQENFRRADLLSDKIHFIVGPVEGTLLDPRNLPLTIDFLRLDTDFYESTKIELEVLYPRIVVGGLIAVDDFGHWRGSRKAVDEYFNLNGNRPILQYVDYTCRIGVKC